MSLLTTLLIYYLMIVLMDTKGPEIRTGFFANEAKSIELVKGNTLILTSDYSFKGDSSRLACSYPQLATSVEAGQQILVADGSLVLTVLTTDPAAGTVACRIENNAKIGERKNMNLPGVKVDLPTFTKKDVEDIGKLNEHFIYIHIPYLSSASCENDANQLYIRFTHIGFFLYSSTLCDGQ